MLRVAEHYAASDTGRQRRANEDSLLARSPLFVVADGMGGAQAGEVASRLAIESFEPGLAEGLEPELALAELARDANHRIHELSDASAEHAGMGTTLTAIWVGEQDVALAHVGDSRAYCLRGAELYKLTDDHSLVDELLRQGRLTPEEAVEHPQRSVITRALGPEGAVEVDTRSLRGQDGDVYLICSDGLTTMISEEQIRAILLAQPRLSDAGEALIAAANEAGGRDNITVLLFRLEDVQLAGMAEDAGAQATASIPVVEAPPAAAPSAAATARSAPGTATATERRPARSPRRPPGASAPRPRRRLRHAKALTITAVLVAMIVAGCYLALQSIYFIGTDNRGLVTMYNGVPFELPGHIALYTTAYVSGVSASSVSPARRRTLLDNSLRSEGDAAALIRNLELGQLE